MKKIAPSSAVRSQPVIEPPHAGKKQGSASSNRLAQLAATMNASPRTQVLAQLQTQIGHSPRVEGLKELAAQIHRGTPAQSQRAGDHEVLNPALDAPAEQFAAPSEAVPESSPVIQRYQVEEAPENRQIYARSDNKNMITGMGTPNHDFFVAHTEAFPVMNNVIKDSPLELISRGQKQLFKQTMYQVGLRYKTSRLKDEARKEQIKQKTVKEKFFESEDRSNLQLEYQKKILPNIKLYRENILKETIANIDQLGLNKSVVKAIRSNLYELMTSLNLFKKVFNAELANKGEFDEGSAELASVGLGLIRTVEEPLYRTDLTRQDLKAARQSLLETWFDEDDRDNPNLISKIVYGIRDNLEALIKAFPRGQRVNMMLFQKYNFNLEIIQQLYDKDNLVLYRACDVQASTLLGNKITKENAQLLKVYNANVDRYFHYVTKILESGGDWVTLEHFAADPRDKLISGTEEAKFKNLDHTWQYIMQGSHPSTVEGVSNEDKYFEIYTKIRYYLKGVEQHQAGGFDTSKRPTEEQPQKRVQLGEFSHLANVMGWRAFYEKIADKKKEYQLMDGLNKIEETLYQGLDPLVHAKQAWDDLMALLKS